MNYIDIIFASISIILVISICFVSCYACWHNVFRKPKVEPAICVKCKYCIKTKWWEAHIKKTLCRTPNDPTPINYITGKKTYPKFSCDRYNLFGVCPNYKKVWWRR